MLGCLSFLRCRHKCRTSTQCLKSGAATETPENENPNHLRDIVLGTRCRGPKSASTCKRKKRHPKNSPSGTGSSASRRNTELKTLSKPNREDFHTAVDYHKAVEVWNKRQLDRIATCDPWISGAEAVAVLEGIKVEVSKSNYTPRYRKLEILVQLQHLLGYLRSAPVRVYLLIVGRDKQLSQVEVDDPELSRFHIALVNVGGVLVAMDLGTLNGTKCTVISSVRKAASTVDSGPSSCPSQIELKQRKLELGKQFMGSLSRNTFGLENHSGVVIPYGGKAIFELPTAPDYKFCVKAYSLPEQQTVHAADVERFTVLLQHVLNGDDRSLVDEYRTREDLCYKFSCGEDDCNADEMTEDQLESMIASSEKDESLGMCTQEWMKLVQEHTERERLRKQCVRQNFEHIKHDVSNARHVRSTGQHCRVQRFLRGIFNTWIGDGEAASSSSSAEKETTFEEHSDTVVSHTCIMYAKALQRLSAFGGTKAAPCRPLSAQDDEEYVRTVEGIQLLEDPIMHKMMMKPILMPSGYSRELACLLDEGQANNTGDQMYCYDYHLGDRQFDPPKRKLLRCPVNFLLIDLLHVRLTDRIALLKRHDGSGRFMESPVCFGPLPSTLSSKVCQGVCDRYYREFYGRTYDEDEAIAALKQLGLWVESDSCSDKAPTSAADDESRFYFRNVVIDQIISELRAREVTAVDNIVIL